MVSILVILSLQKEPEQAFGHNVLKWGHTAETTPSFFPGKPGIPQVVATQLS